MKIKLLFKYKDSTQKFNQIKFIKMVFGLSLKEAKYANVFSLIKENMKKSVKN